MGRLRAGRLGRAVVVLAALGLVLAVSGCAAPLNSAGKTDRIEFVSSTTSGGYKFDYYRNLSYPCSISGYQTFVIGTKIGSSDTQTRPLWVRMRGGGVGWFDANGNPQPTAGNKTEESASSLIGFVGDVGLTGRVKSDPAGFRLLSVSMCDHDIYAGGDQPDPNNPNKQPDGSPRTTNGLFATKAAIQFAKSKLPTGGVFLHGTSAGSFGAFGVAWSMQLQGVPPAGVVADSGVLNQEWEVATVAQGICPGGRDAGLDAIRARVHPDLANIDNEPDKLVARGALTVPIIHVWNRADNNVCGATPMNCPLRDGTTKTLGAAECEHEPLQNVIAGLPAGSSTRNLRVCVSPANDPGSCSTHVVTNKDLLNTDPSQAADYNGTIIDWVDARLAGT
jgi:hypothetical protein